MTYPRQFNWFESTCRSLRASVPEASETANYVTVRLAMLLLGRLPQELAQEVLSLLPDEARAWFRARRELPPDQSISFPAFVEISRYLLGLSDLLDSPKYSESEEEYDALCSHMAEAFLWAFAQELPTDLKDRIAHHLPADLRCRMNLYSRFSDSEKVA